MDAVVTFVDVLLCVSPVAAAVGFLVVRAFTVRDTEPWGDRLLTCGGYQPRNCGPAGLPPGVIGCDYCGRTRQWDVPQCDGCGSFSPIFQ